MDAKGFRGSVAGIPVRGGAVSINDADAGTILDAASGLVRTTANAAGSVLKIGAGLSLAVGILALLLGDLRTKNAPRIPILSLARIETFDRDFLGVCKDEVFECHCDGEELKIPTCVINRIESSFFGIFEPEFWGYDIGLIDGSSYKNCIPIARQLSFLTICGEQKTAFFYKEEKRVAVGFWGKKEKVVKEWAPHLPGSPSDEISITGATAADLIDLRRRLQFAFDNNAAKVIEIIGKEVFEKYFILG